MNVKVSCSLANKTEKQVGCSHVCREISDGIYLQLCEKKQCNHLVRTNHTGAVMRTEQPENLSPILQPVFKKLLVDKNGS